MPNIFLDDECLQEFQEFLLLQIKELETKIRAKKEHWNMINACFKGSSYNLQYEAGDGLYAELGCPGKLKGLARDAVKISGAETDDEFQQMLQDGVDEKEYQKEEIGEDSQVEKPEVDPKTKLKLHKQKSPGIQLLVLAPPKAEMLIPKFEFDKDMKRFYENIFFYELPDGRVVLEYGEAKYYTTKDNVIKLQYPFPSNYFDSKRGWNTTIEQAFKKYRKYLTEQDEKNDPDRIYKPMLKQNTKPNREEEKVEGVLE